MLKDAYPNHDWQVWRFKSGIPDDFWDNPENEKNVMKYLEEKLGVKTPEVKSDFEITFANSLGLEQDINCRGY